MKKYITGFYPLALPARRSLGVVGRSHPERSRRTKGANGFQKRSIILVLCLACLQIHPKEEDKAPHLEEGNLALPTSQQPSPLFSFGQNIVDKKDAQIFVTPDQLKGKHSSFKELVLSALYGISDDMSLYINVPFATKFKELDKSSKGIEDISVQLEYVLYNNSTFTYGDQITIVSNFTLPTGSFFKKPITGFGSTSFFLGFTASHTAVNWYYYASTGGQFTTQFNKNKIGRQFFYQFGIGKNIPTSPKWIITPILEFNGTFYQKDKINGKLDCNTGGNVILFGPSLWISNKTIVIQPGISFIPFQRLNGTQNRDKYFAAINFRYKFDS